MAASATNLLIGVGSMWSAPFGTADPVETTPLADPVSPFADLGGTEGGVSVNVERDFYELRMDQTLMTPARRLTKVDVMLETNLAEPTLENMKTVLAGAAPSAIATIGTGGTSSKALDIDPGAGADPSYLAVLFRGWAPAGKRRHVLVRKALSVENVKSEYKKDGQTFVPVTFAAHWVSTSVKAVRVIDEVGV